MLDMFFILALLVLPTLTAAASLEEIADALIDANDTENLEPTFRTFETQQNGHELQKALALLAVQDHIPIVVKCLRMTHDHFPQDKLCVNSIIHFTIHEISNSTDAESFAKVVTSFNNSDIKPLACIRDRTISRDDSVDVLKIVMAKSPELITDDLPSWLTPCEFESASYFFTIAHEGVFQYLTSFATQGVLEKAFSIVKENIHYKVEWGNGGAPVDMRCWSQEPLHQNLSNRLKDLLKVVKTRGTLVNDLSILLKVLVDLVLEYTVCDIPPDSRASRIKTCLPTQCCIIA